MPFIVIDNPSGVYSNYLKCHCRLGVQKAMSIDNPGQVYRESGGDRTWYLQPLSSTVVCSLSVTISSTSLSSPPLLISSWLLLDAARCILTACLTSPPPGDITGLDALRFLPREAGVAADGPVEGAPSLDGPGSCSVEVHSVASGITSGSSSAEPHDKSWGEGTGSG